MKKRRVERNLFCYCHFGGQIVLKEDKSVSYKGGSVDGIVIDQDTTYEGFIGAVCDRLGISPIGKLFQYSLKFDKSVLLPLKDRNALENLLNFNEGAGCVYVYEIGEDTTPLHFCTRSSNAEPLSGTGQHAEVGPDHSAVDAVDNHVEVAADQQAEVEADQHVEVEFADEDSFQCSDTGNHSTGEHAYDDFAERDPSSSLICTAPEKPPFDTQEWEKELIGTGQQFESADAFRLALYKYSVAKCFNYKFKRNTTGELSVRCAADGCPWKVCASRVRSTKVVKVNTFVEVHEHSGQDETSSRPSVRSKFIGRLIKEKIEKSPNYSTRQICKDIESDLSIKLTYAQSYHIKEQAKMAIYGKVGDSYKLIPWMCQRLTDVMPGTIATWLATEDKRFKQLFVAYHCSIHGFQLGCRPVLFIDEYHFSVPYKGMLLSVTSVDANDGVFPLAYGVIASDTDMDWLWFLEKLKSVVGDREVVIISDRNEGMSNGINEVFGSENHAGCYRHLKINFSSYISQFKLHADGKENALALLDNVAFARSASDYNKALSTMHRFNKDIYEWILANEPEYWANSLFKKKRWDKLNSDETDSFSSWLSNECQKPVLEFMKAHRRKLSELLHSRQKDVVTWKDPVGDKIESKIRGNLSKSDGLIVRQISQFVFEVKLHSSTNVVNLSMGVCSCCEWQMTGIPCPHACSAGKWANLDVYRLVENWYFKETQETIYAGVLCDILPTHDMPRFDDIADSNGDASIVLQPPESKRPSGRPRRKPKIYHFMDKRSICCTHCNEKGHNKRSCKKRMLEQSD